jgi:hypothetical protein
MATKREDIEHLISKTMEGRDIAASVPSGSGNDVSEGTLPETSFPQAAPLAAGRFDPPVKKQVQIRFDPGDYETLQRIAYRKGTVAAALVRQAVKDIIRTEGGET